jgi:hypothetical protein
MRSPSAPERRTELPRRKRFQTGDDAVVVAESLGVLRPLELQHE